MEENEARRRKIEEGRRRLEKLRNKKESDKNAVHAAKKPLPSPFATAARKMPEFKPPEASRKSAVATPRDGAANKENLPAALAKPEEDDREKKELKKQDVTKEQQLVRDMLGAAGDLSDPKKIDAEIQKLRDLDRSYDRNYTPHQTIQASEKSQQLQPEVESQPAEITAHEHAAPVATSVSTTPRTAQTQVPANRRQEGPPPLDTRAAATTPLTAQESVVPEAYLSPTKLIGASRGVHFGTGCRLPHIISRETFCSHMYNMSNYLHLCDPGLDAQLHAAAAYAAVPEPAERVDAPTAQDAQPYVTDGVVFTRFPTSALSVQAHQSAERSRESCWIGVCFVRVHQIYLYLPQAVLSL